MVKVLVFLSFLSGVCGIAYEILFSRLLSICFGDMFYVAAAILASFLLALGIGSFAAEKWARHLWKIEILIGVCALIIDGVFGFCSDEIISHYLPGTGGSALWIILSVFTVLGIPAFLIGFSVPLFSLYFERCMKEESLLRPFHSFRQVYCYYNLGAVFCVLGVEFFLIRTLGIRNTVFCMAQLNFLIGAAVRFFYGNLSFSETKVQKFSFLLKKKEVLLFFASVLSGIFQLLFLKMAETLFGPYHENFAVILAVGLFSLSFSTVFVSGLSWSFLGWLTRGGFLCLGSFLFFHPLIYFWAWLNEVFSWSPQITTFIKVEILFLIGIIPMTVFGGTVPALIRDDKESSPGRLLGISSFGNCAGYLLMVFVIYEHFSCLSICLMMASCLFGMGGISLKSSVGKKVLFISAFSVLGALLIFTWPDRLLQLSYEDFKSLGAIRGQTSKYESCENLKKFGHQVSLLHEGGQICLVIDGYKSMYASKGKKGNLRELMFGLVPAYFSARREEALVLGVGTGITAGTSAKVFRKIKAVDINPLMFQILPLFSLQNFDLQNAPNAEFVFNDALIELGREDKRYDAIINTVTTPLFFSSSKLYTRDFFGIISRHLKQDGIYAFWFDCRVGRQGAEIIYETLRQSFRYCAMVFLSRDYVQMICSQSPFRISSIPDSEFPVEIREVFKAYDIPLKPEEFVKSLILTKNSIHQTQWKQRVNTYDFPVLEFAMSSFAIHNPGFEDRSLYAMAGVDIPSNPLLIPGENALEKRAAALRFIENKFDPGTFLESKPDFDFCVYTDLVLPKLLKTKAAAGEMLKLCELLLAHGHREKCLAVLKAMTKDHFRFLPLEEQESLKVRQRKITQRLLSAGGKEGGQG